MKSGIELRGYENIKGKALAPTEVVKEVLNNYQEIGIRIADLLPIYILKNKSKIDLFEVYDFAIENDLISFTGYIFDIVQSYSYCKEFENFLASLENKKDKVGIVRDKRYEKAIDLIKQDDISRKWKIYTLNKAEDYENYFELYA